MKMELPSNPSIQKQIDTRYIIPKRITIDEIAEALESVLLPSDAAVLAYPYGSTSSGASAMRIRLFGTDAQTILGGE